MAYYRPSYLYPDGNAINPSVNNTFTCQVNASGSTVTSAQLKIYTLTNSLIYTASTPISPALSDKETLSMIVPSGTLTAGTQYKWTISPNYTAATPILSKETQFYAYSAPTLVFSATPASITAKSHEFVLVYTQAQSVAPKRWKIIWYDSNSEILEDSGWSTSGNLKHTFDGFSSGSSYSVKGFLENQVGTLIETALYSFTVTYAQPTLNVRSNISINNETSVITSSWTQAIQVAGTPTGTYEYVPNFLVTDNIALHLNTSANVLFNVNIPLNFTAKFLIQVASGFVGVFCKLGDNYSIGYDGTRFYTDINGYITYSDPYDLTSTVLTDTTPLYDDTKLGYNKVFQMFVLPTRLLIREAGVY